MYDFVVKKADKLLVFKCFWLFFSSLAANWILIVGLQFFGRLRFGATTTVFIGLSD